MAKRQPPKQKKLQKRLRGTVEICTRPGGVPERFPVELVSREILQAINAGQQAKAEHLASELSRQVVIPPVANFLLSTLHRRNAFERLETTARELVAIDPGFADAYNALCEACRRRADYPAALEAIDRAVRLQPRNPHFHNHQGLIHKEMGELERARDCFNRAIALDPRLYAAYEYRADLGLELEPTAITEMRALCARDDLGTAPGLHFALARALEEQGEYEQAWPHWSEGNRQRRAALDFDIAGFVAQHRAIETFYSAAPMAAADPPPGGGQQPIFIVGFPRCGSTLLEQILSSHPRVVAAGETAWLQLAIEAQLNRTGINGMFPRGMDSLGPAGLAAIGEGYAGFSRQRLGADTRFTDKTLANYLFIGVIKALLPQARIIHLRRDPRDTMLGCFRQNFAQSVLYSFDLDELCQAYRAYAGLMAHWQRQYPGQLYELDYETLVGQPEETVRELLAYCGLDWHPDCLEFQRNRRAVMTASSAQVRQPLFRAGVERWRRYEAMLPESFREFDSGRE